MTTPFNEDNIRTGLHKVHKSVAEPVSITKYINDLHVKSIAVPVHGLGNEVETIQW